MDPVEQPAPPLAQLFSGDFSFPVDEFLVLVETNTLPHKCYYAHTPHKTAYVANALTGRARLWYVRWAGEREHKAPVYNEKGQSFQSAWKTYKDKHYETFRRDLVAQFGIPEFITPPFALRHLTQNRLPVQQYVDRWTELANACLENLDSEYNRYWFIYGLRKEIRDHMLEVFPFFRTFAKIVDEAKAMEKHLQSKVVERVIERVIVQQVPAPPTPIASAPATPEVTTSPVAPLAPCAPSTPTTPAPPAAETLASPPPTDEIAVAQ
ncbi:hypothetical protein A1Q2_02433 [Trichosporon asahii var. asahii CBS 8904]|uniref:Retrotransposon gag domain-containing protein n=1 Tax=Trichosporon asahii var. asahii (strain CBS 8904) TaxID=1220162 RepID=K1W351_TRIAC|nr:hypothetical protein A1Q2_02433 [Trichosporon asahii var. asahii CBS 8904]